jgi:hypothetical protein
LPKRSQFVVRCSALDVRCWMIPGIRRQRFVEFNGIVRVKM